MGLDLSQEQLERAPVGSYDWYVVSDLADRQSMLESRFDLAVSFQVLEHVRHLEDTIDNILAYLVPGGHFVAQLSGRYSAFGLLNLVLPQRVGVFALEKLVGRRADSVWPAHYDRCWHAALVKCFRRWSRVRIVPLYVGAGYFRFSRVAQNVYLMYEDWLVRSNILSLATHYVIDATR